MSLIERAQHVEQLHSEWERKRDELTEELAPSLEEWNKFVSAFAASFTKTHITANRPYGVVFPWKEVGLISSGDWRSPLYTIDTDCQVYFNEKRQSLQFSGRDYDGDWESCEVPLDFFLDQAQSKARLKTEWTRRGEGHLQREEEAAQAKELKEFERLQAKFAK